MNLNNVLDKEFEEMLFPLYLMQYVILQPKFRIIKSAIKPNGFFFHVIYFFGVVLMIFINVFRIVTVKLYVTSEFANINHLTSFVACVFYTGYCIALFIFHILQGNKNMLLVTKMHEVYKILNIPSNDLRKLRFMNWIYIVIMLLLTILYTCFQQNLYLFSYSYLMYVFSTFYYFGSIVYATGILNLLTHEVKLWKDEMENYVVKCSQTNNIPLRKYLNEVRVQGERLSRAYFDIMAAIKLCGNLYHVPIILLAVDVFSRSLLVVQTFIEKNKILGGCLFESYSMMLAILASVIMAVKNFTLLTCVCVAYQNFWLAVADVDTACVVASANDECLADVRRLCKNVRRVTSALAGGGMRAGGVVAVDAALPMRLLALLATYTVVLLQFAFL